MPGREVQLFRALQHPLRENRSTLRTLTLRDRPMLEPTGPFLPCVSIGQAVGRIAQRFLERDESITTFAQNVEQFANVIGFQITGVEQQNLFRLVANDLLRQLLEISN